MPGDVSKVITHAHTTRLPLLVGDGVLKRLIVE